MFFVPACFAQSQAPRHAPSDQSTAGSCQVSGEVIDAITQQPIHKVSLQLVARGPARGMTQIQVGGAGGVVGSPQSYAARSDDSGHFLFPAVPPGDYILQGYGNDYPVQVYGQPNRFSPSKILNLTPGHSQDNLEFKLDPGVVITGRVADEDGDPVANAFVTAVARRYVRGRVLYSRSGGVRTDDLGNYRMYALPAGRYYVSATKASRRFRAGATGDVIYSTKFYPGTTDPTTATALEAKPGDTESGIDIMLTPMQPARLSGSVNGAGGRHGFFVMLQPADPEWTFAGGPVSQVQRMTPQGGFEILDAPPGSYILTAISRGRTQQLMAQLPVTLTAGEDLTGLNLTLSPGAELSGTVTADASPGFEVSSLFVRLDSETNQFDRQGFARVAADGTFTMHNLFPGKYRLETRVPPPYYLKSATLNGADVLDAGATILPGSPPGPLAIALGLDGGTLTGNVTGTDGQPLSDAAVVLVPDPPRRDRDDLYKVAHTDAMGAFTLDGIAPGSYKVFAWENVENEEYRDPDFMKQYEDQGQSVDVAASGRQNLRLQVIPMQTASQQ